MVSDEVHKKYSDEISGGTLTKVKKIFQVFFIASGILANSSIQFLKA